MHLNNMYKENFKLVKIVLWLVLSSRQSTKWYQKQMLLRY